MDSRLALTMVLLAMCVTLADSFSRCKTIESFRPNDSDSNEILSCPNKNNNDMEPFDKNYFCCQKPDGLEYFCCDLDTYLDLRTAPFNKPIMIAGAIVLVMICIGAGCSIWDCCEHTYYYNKIGVLSTAGSENLNVAYPESVGNKIEVTSV
ncbi:Hypothetical predicted protein [Cloeon dipterum]|uniref:CX domain-containing protein n=1 Tax=Cloeon dipterum TaxID=197152 RepID=A0A8S1BZP8_9INSE|nr:Hypothetical predicted protein [Cloeon dipterum]